VLYWLIYWFIWVIEAVWAF